MPRTPISVVLPVWNERENIAACLRGLWAALRGEEHEILVCYDRDEDDTLPAIAAMPDAPPSVRLVKNTIGRGAANAIRAGFAAARGDVVVTSMADLSDPPEVILAMAQKIRAGADVVAGSRYMRGGSQSGGPWMKRTLSRLAGISLRWIAGLGTRDATSNFRGYSKRFLETVSVESRAGFEIALELTVKAHLQGARVEEVPSSWVDRSAGQSRFRMWKWMPNYLRWYARAAAAPVLAWGLLAALAWVGFSQAPPPTWGGAVRLRLLVLSALAAGALALARAARGRNTLLDVAHPLLFLLPRLLGLSWAVHVPAAGTASALLLGASSGWRRTLAVLRDSFRPSASSALPRAWVLTLLFLLVWMVHRTMPLMVPTVSLDSSWAAALAHMGQAGRDFLFTYGPLGFFHTANYDTGWFWQKLLVWEGAFKLLLAAIFLAVGARIRPARDLWLFFLLLLVHPAYPDPVAILSIVALAVWVIGREETGVWQALVALAVLAVLPLVKFSFVLPALAATAAIVASKRSSLGLALGLSVAFLAFVAIFWSLAGQQLQHLPAYCAGSARIAAGYGESMSLPGPPSLRVLGLASVALLAVQAALLAFSGRAGGWLIACAFLPTLWVAYKAGFVRASDHTRSYFDFALIAPFLLAAAGDPLGPLGRFAGVVRLASTGLTLIALSLSLGFGWRLPTELVANVVRRLDRTLDVSLEPRWFRYRSEVRLASARKSAALPHVRAEVGEATIDFVSHQQSVLFLNELAWRHRPVFQGYATFTPELMELNAAFFESDRASEFVLFHLETIDERLPTMDDALALQVLLRDYRPVLTEKEYLLLRREPRPELSPPTPVIQREIAFGETVDLSTADGRCRLLRLDIRYNPAGRIRVLLDCAPPLFVEVVLDSGKTRKVRIVPGMIRAGAIIDPLLSTQSDWIAWHGGETVPRPIALRVLEPESAWMYRDKIGFELLAADDLEPPARPELLASFLYSPFETKPVEVRADGTQSLQQVDETPVLFLHAPSEMRFELEAGAHTLTGRFGFLPDATAGAGTDGASFRAVLREADGGERVLFERFLDPQRVPGDRGLQEIRSRFETEAPASLFLRTEPGPRDEKVRDWTCWTEIRLE